MRALQRRRDGLGKDQPRPSGRQARCVSWSGGRDGFGAPAAPSRRLNLNFSAKLAGQLISRLEIQDESMQSKIELYLPASIDS